MSKKNTSHKEMSDYFFMRLFWGTVCLLGLKQKLQLAEEMVNEGVDLIVLEGMGRAIHTNFHTKFKCESLKVAVLKNRWLAQHLGGDMFSVVFKYETIG